MKAIWGVTTALLVGVSGCASKSTIPDVTEDGLQRVDIRGVDAAYLRPGADLNKYRKVMLDPVQVAFDPDWDPKRTGSNLKVSAEDRANQTGLKWLDYFDDHFPLRTALR